MRFYPGLLSPVGSWLKNIPTVSLQSVLDMTLNNPGYDTKQSDGEAECPENDTKQSDGEALVMPDVI